MPSEDEYINKLVPKEDDLHLYWYKEKGQKFYTIVCSCGNNKLLVAKNGLRCQHCANFHSHKTFLTLKQQIKKIVENPNNADTAAIEQLPQPFLYKMSSIKKQLNAHTKIPLIGANQRLNVNL